MVEAENPETRILLGGGISSGRDLAAGLDHGADAAGASSAFVDAEDRQAWLTEIADSVTAAANSFGDDR